MLSKSDRYLIFIQVLVAFFVPPCTPLPPLYPFVPPCTPLAGWQSYEKEHLRISENFGEFRRTLENFGEL